MTEDEQRAVAALVDGQRVRFRALSADERYATVFDVQAAYGRFHLMDENRHVAEFGQFDELWVAAIAICPKVAIVQGEPDDSRGRAA